MSTVVPPPINDPKVRTSLMMAMMTLSNINVNDNTKNDNIFLYDYRQSRGESSQKSLTKTSDEGDGGKKANGWQKIYLTTKGYSPLMSDEGSKKVIDMHYKNR